MRSVNLSLRSLIGCSLGYSFLRAMYCVGLTFVSMMTPFVGGLRLVNGLVSGMFGLRWGTTSLSLISCLQLRNRVGSVISLFRAQKRRRTSSCLQYLERFCPSGIRERKSQFLIHHLHWAASFFANSSPFQLPSDDEADAFSDISD